MLSDLFYHLGTVVGSLGAPLTGKHGAAGAEPGPQRPTPDAGAHESGGPRGGGDAGGAGVAGGAGEAHQAEAIGHAGSLAAGAAATWLASRVLSPRPVSWTRVVIAGVAATFLADLAERTFDTDRPRPRSPVTEDPEALLRRFGAGVAVAAGYASLLYPRLPGPPLLRGLAFGALEVATAPRGGLVGLASETRGLRFPLQALAAPMDESAGPIARMAFGVGLGLFYHHGESADDGEDDDVEEGTGAE